MESMQILLKHGETALVDADDYERLSKLKWYAVSSRDCKYAKTGKNGRMHRIILNVTDPKLIVDHINGDGLDNRKTNLRVVSNLENIKNRQRPSGKRLSIPGVYRRNNKWATSVCVDYKDVWLGLFDTEEEAIEVVNKFRVSIGRPPVLLQK